VDDDKCPNGKIPNIHPPLNYNNDYCQNGDDSHQAQILDDDKCPNGKIPNAHF
jgi:hypothetical protein